MNRMGLNVVLRSIINCVKGNATGRDLTCVNSVGDEYAREL